MIVDIIFGFLGSGKTTFIIRALERWGVEEKIVVLVNEFGDVGIDGDLLTGQGGDVVEMPSGCICCTLQTDFRAQMLEISQTVKPDRVIVEPTGVATIAQVRSIVEAQLFEHVIKRINNVLIADVTGFMALYKANRHFVESQVRNAQLALLNKCDRVDKKKAMVTQGALSAINPEMTVLMTEFGAVDWAEYQFALSTAPSSGKGVWRQDDNRMISDRSERPFHHHQERAKAGGEHVHFNEAEDALGYESFGCVYPNEAFNQEALEAFFQQLKASNSGMGDIVRAKGIFRVTNGWMLMELASGEFSSQPLRQSAETRVSIIGKGLDRELIESSLAGCIS